MALIKLSLPNHAKVRMPNLSTLTFPVISFLTMALLCWATLQQFSAATPYHRAPITSQTSIHKTPAKKDPAPGNSPAAKNTTLQDVIRDSKQSIVKVEAEGCGGYIFQGTGFFVTPDVVITNAHTVAGTSYISVASGDYKHRAVAIHFDARSDYALLRLHTVKGKPLPLSTHSQGAYVLGTNNGLRVAVLGYPEGSYKAQQSIIRNEFLSASYNIYGEQIENSQTLELAAQIRSGNSGSPVIMKNGQVAGMITGIDAANENIAYATPVSEFYKQVQSAKKPKDAVPTQACVNND